MPKIQGQNVSIIQDDALNTYTLTPIDSVATQTEIDNLNIDLKNAQASVALIQSHIAAKTALLTQPIVVVASLNISPDTLQTNLQPIKE